MTYEAVRFEHGSDAPYKAVANGELQRPDFQCKGSALAFAKAVAEGKRKAEPVKDKP